MRPEDLPTEPPALPVRSVRVGASGGRRSPVKTAIAQSVQAADQVAEAPADDPQVSQGGTTGRCLLNLNSMPFSNVVVDGHPLGGTPKLGISVGAGSHHLTFIRSTSDKKSIDVSCQSGETKSIAIRVDASN